MDFYLQLPSPTQSIIGLIALACAAALANMIVKHFVLRMVERGLARFGFEAGTAYLDPVARRLANIVPAIIVSRGVALVPYLPGGAVSFIINLAHALIVLSIVLALSAALNIVNVLYQRRPHAANRPIKGYLQVAKMILFAAATILIAAILMDQSPLLLLSGLGAMAAVLMLVFKDTILSLVASVQLTSNDMLRVGDWIEAPQFDADGDVVDIALHTVKVQNFDKTVTTIPTHRLISEPFRNWRGMKEAGARRIMRALHIDQNSIRFLSGEQKTELARFAQLQDYLAGKAREMNAWNRALSERGGDPANHRELTNIGTFRAYVRAYIASHPRIDGTMIQLTRQLSPTPEGLPVQIYCFASTTDWSEYEAIQADIFDHLIAVLPKFGLRLFQKPGGMDLRSSHVARKNAEQGLAA